MPVYTWNKLKAHPITPAYSVAMGEVVSGDKIICIRTDYSADRGDGQIGAKSHVHPEEQVMVMIEGKVNIEIDGVWTEMGPGDVAVIPPYASHQLAAVGNSYKMYNIKDRINGHSVYTYGAWEPGSEEHYKKIEALLEESKKFPIKDPWFE